MKKDWRRIFHVAEINDVSKDYIGRPPRDSECTITNWSDYILAKRVTGKLMRKKKISRKSSHLWNLIEIIKWKCSLGWMKMMRRQLAHEIFIRIIFIILFFFIFFGDAFPFVQRASFVVIFRSVKVFNSCFPARWLIELKKCATDKNERMKLKMRGEK